MKTVRIHEYGGAERLQYEDAPQPEAGAGEVLVRVRAASVNPVDYKLASGAYRKGSPPLPWTPGGDFAGIIDSVGEDIEGLEIGAEVYGDCRPGGGYAEFVATKLEWVAAKPPSLSFVEAASVPLAAQTAWQGLFDHGQLEKGQRVLIHGAPGGVGTFAVQLAHWKGAEVTATGSVQDEEYLRSLGVDQLIDYKQTKFEDKVSDLDLVFDLIGGETLERSCGVVKRGGTLITTVQEPSAEKAAERGIRAEVYMMQPSCRNLEHLTRLIEEGVLKPVVAATYPLEQAAEAWRHLQGQHTQGKIVLEVSR
ncbi:MAG: NADP-dependent oxidoreductase [Armatimonadia bacterium]